VTFAPSKGAPQLVFPCRSATLWVAPKLVAVSVIADPAVALVGCTEVIVGVGATVPGMASVWGADVCPATVTVTVAVPGASGNWGR